MAMGIEQGTVDMVTIDEIEAAAKDGDSLGGIVEVLAYGLPVGLGSYVHWDRKIDGLLSQAIMSILPRVARIEAGEILFHDPDRPGTATDIAKLDPHNLRATVIKDNPPMKRAA